MIAQINDNREVYCDTSFLCNEHENDASKIIVNLPKSLVSDDYFYYIVCKSPDNVIPEFAVPLLLKNGNELIYLIGSNIGSISGRWEFCIVVKSVELDESGDIGTNGLIAITDTFHGNVESGIINEGELGEQPMDPNLQLLYDELLALTAAIRPHLHDIAQLAEELKAYRDDAEDFKNDAQFSAATAQNAKDEAVNLLIVIQGISNDLDALVVQINSLVTGFNVSKLDFDTKYADVLSKYNDFSTKYTDFLSKYNTIDDDVAAVAADKVTVQGILTTVQGIKTNIDQVKNDIELTKSSIDTIYADIIENYGGLANKIDKSQIVNDLVTGGADDVASAETVKILNGDKLPNSHNADVEAHPDIREQYGTIQTQTILENYLSSHNIPSTAKRGKLDVELKGMTRVNLLGVDGNCEDLTKWNGLQSILSLDSINKVFGNNSIKWTATLINGWSAIEKRNLRLDSTKHYLISAYLKNGNFTNGVGLTFGGNTTITTSVAITDTLKFSRVGLKINSSIIKSDGTNILQITNFIPSGTQVGEYGYVDCIMIQEISQDEYVNESMDSLFSKYPYHDGLQGSTNIQVLSTGKNLFDKSKALLGYYVNGTNGVLTSSLTDFASDYIKVKPNTTYIRNIPQTIVFFDINKKHIGYVISTQFTTDSSTYYVRLNGGINTLDILQLEQGTTETDHEEYKGTENALKTLDGQPITLHRLPNGVFDEITVDGKYIKRMGEKTLVASDISYYGDLTGYAWYLINKSADDYNYGNAETILENATRALIEGGTPIDNRTQATSIGQYVNFQISTYAYTFATGTTLAQAQAALVGKKLIYQLKQPQILDTNAVPLIAEPNGHVFISSDSCMPENTISYPLNLGAVMDGLIEGQKELSVLLKNNTDNKADRTEIVNYKTPSDLPGSYKLGLTVFSSNLTEWSTIVNNAPLVNVRTFMVNPSAIYQEITAYGASYNNIKKFRVANLSNVWGAWQEIVTTTPTAWLNATLQSGYTGYIRFRRNQIGQLEINLIIGSGTITAGTTIAILPEGYRPLSAVLLPVYQATDGKAGQFLAINASGVIHVPTVGGGIEASKSYHGQLITA